MNAVDDYVARLRALPRRYLAAALGCALLVLLLQLSSPPVGQSVFNGTSTGLYREINVLVAFLEASACVVALTRLVLPVLMVALVPAGLLVLAHEWCFATFLALLVVQVVAARTFPRRAWLAGVVGIGFAATYLAGVRVLAPDGAVGDPQYASTHERAVVVALYALAVLLVQGFAIWFRYSADLATLAEDRRTVSRDSAELGERARLARDLHDVVAHHVSLIAVRAETAPYSEDDLGAGGRRVLAEIADDARRALEELRGVLGVLRRADGSVETSPLPTGADVARLVDEAGVTATGVEQLAALPSAIGYVAYRVVQEALTNARRHAPGAAVRVAVSSGGGQTTVTIRNDVPGTVEVVPGAGLTGMRERVEAVGGSLVVEARGDELVVEAVLPS